MSAIYHALLLRLTLAQRSADRLYEQSCCDDSATNRAAAATLAANAVRTIRILQRELAVCDHD